MTHAAGMVVAAALGGHLVHVIVFGGALLLAATVYGVATVTAPRELSIDTPASASHRHHRDHRAPAAIVQQLAFLGLCAAAGTHLAVMPAHFRQSWIYGTFFAVVAPMQIGLAWLVLVRPGRRELSATLTFCIAVVVLWAFTRFVGVPIGPDHGATEEFGVLDIFATLSELVTAGALFYLLHREHPVHSQVASAWRWSLWPPLTRVMLGATLVAVPLLSVLAPRS